MKIFTAVQMKELDQCTILAKNTSLPALIECAARACFNWLQSNGFENAVYKVFCGPGNNGADGVALARLLLENGNKVNVYGNLTPP
jgi:NAD(P)H-hydrate repair Nnr-like enzyme with NAD(P)H-hydrate epimerase domain